MTHLRILVALFGLAALGACASPDIASRNLATGTLDIAAISASVVAPEGEALIAQYDVRNIRVTVPETLSVSEANLYYPLADIVWRGEPRGNRHGQVRAIFEEAFAKGTDRMTKGPAVDVEVTVNRFHSVSEKTRYSFGGVHSLRYTLTVRDAATGAVLDGPRRLALDVRASGGRKAIEEDGLGLTQRVVIVHNLAHAALRDLSVRADVTPEMPLTRIDSDIGLTLAAVSMKDDGSVPVFTDAARARIADYAR